MVEKKQRKRIFIPAEGARIELVSDVWDGEVFDTRVRIDALFVIQGVQTKEFCEEISALVRKYQI